MNEKFIITIGRQYGSGGRMIGQKLAKDLNIPCYDKELLTIAAKESGFSEEILETMDEKPTACLQSISPAAQRFIESTYDGIREYLTTRIEAKMRKQKGDAALALSVPMLGELVSTVETTVKKTDLNVGAMRPETA